MFFWDHKDPEAGDRGYSNEGEAERVVQLALFLVQQGYEPSQITVDSIKVSQGMEAFGLQFGHGLGLALHERPIISRLVSLDNPFEIKEGMVFALETYCPAADGNGAARIEEEVVVTPDGCRVITLFPAQELFIANEY